MDVNFIGIAVLAAGAALGFGSEGIAKALMQNNQKKTESVSIALKAAGFVAAAVGALIAMRVI